MANNKDVVVTGVSTGIGWGTTKVLVSKGFRVFGSVRKQADADRLQGEFGNDISDKSCDVTLRNLQSVVRRLRRAGESGIRKSC